MRLFIGIRIDDSVARALAASIQTLEVEGAQLRFISPEQIHLTLVFLGQTSDNLLPELHDLVRNACKKVGPFDLSLDRLGYFPKRGPVRAIWAGGPDVTLLKTLHDFCCSELTKLGFELEEREFHPHLTLARVREDRSRGRLRRAVDEVELEQHAQHVASIELISSVSTSKESHYETVFSALLDPGC